MGASARDAEFARLALPLLPVVARVARSLTRDGADADDLVQETYLRAYRYWHSFDQATDCRKWLATICRNVWFDTLRRESHVTVVNDTELESLAAARVHRAAVAAGLGDMYSRVDLGPAISRAVASLDIPFRARHPLSRGARAQRCRRVELRGDRERTRRSHRHRAIPTVSSAPAAAAGPHGLRARRGLHDRSQQIESMTSFRSSHRSECEEVVRRLWPHLDGTLPDTDRERVTLHLEGCANCRSHFDFALAFLDAVSSAQPDPYDHERLRARVLAALGSEGFSA
jgi:RNA polymerase sigma factor (sigma-70 family)